MTQIIFRKADRERTHARSLRAIEAAKKDFMKSTETPDSKLLAPKRAEQKGVQSGINGVRTKRAPDQHALLVPTPLTATSAGESPQS